MAPTPQDTPCIETTWRRNSRGYGMKGRWPNTVYAHRVAWEEAHGAIPAGMFVCHKCDNPPCANVEHLFLGTPAQNTSDMVAKGRNSRGQGHPFAVLNETAVLEIRERHAAGESRNALADRFGIALPTVDGIVIGTSWKHVGGPIAIKRPRACTSKATHEEIEAARRMRAEGMTLADIGDSLGRHHVTILRWVGTSAA